VLEHLGSVLVVAFSIAIEQHPSLQSAQVGKFEPIARLLGKLADID
jgi:hypothetical protein